MYFNNISLMNKVILVTKCELLRLLPWKSSSQIFKFINMYTILPTLTTNIHLMSKQCWGFQKKKEKEKNIFSHLVIRFLFHLINQRVCFNNLINGWKYARVVFVELFSCFLQSFTIWHFSRCQSFVLLKCVMTFQIGIFLCTHFCNVLFLLLLFWKSSS